MSLLWDVRHNWVDSGVVLLVEFYCFIEIPILHASSVGPDQMPCSVASDLDLHCFANVPFMGR